MKDTDTHAQGDADDPFVGHHPRRLSDRFAAQGEQLPQDHNQVKSEQTLLRHDAPHALEMIDIGENDSYGRDLRFPRGSSRSIKITTVDQSRQGPRPVSYVLDSKAAFVYCNPGWDKFARENDGVELMGDEVHALDIFLTCEAKGS